jgi:hypothetical protein
MPDYDRLRSFLTRVAALSDGELLAIIAAGERNDRSGERQAMRLAERATKEAAIGRELDRARDQIIAWATDQGTGTGQLSGFPMPETIVGNLRRRAAPELINAAFAIALGDRLTREASDPLLFAWRSVVEGHASPVPRRGARS